MSALRSVLALVAVFISGAALADETRPLTLASDVAEPYLAVLRERGTVALQATADAQAADARVLEAREALALRAAGVPLRVVYVLGRNGDRHDVLAVREATLSARAADVERLLAALEDARRWIQALPADAAALVGRIGGDAALATLATRDFGVARPGPALENLLARSADRTLAHALLDDAPLRAALRAAPAASVALLK